MRITFLAHSGFLIELEHCCLLFDWWNGDLPALPDKPLICFASHRHPDHFDPHIFALDDGSRAATFVLANDLKLTARNRRNWELSDETAAKCRFVAGEQTLSLPGVMVETLRSTDKGVAFVVTAEGKTLYHAGDLNWWAWSGEDAACNRNMECNFKRYLEPLRGRILDVAFAPLDPRQEADYGLGLSYLLEIADVRRVFPMHQWEDFALTQTFCAAHPLLAERVMAVERNGQCWEIPG